MALVQCVNCMGIHELSTESLVTLVKQFQNGDMQRVTPFGIEPECIRTTTGPKPRRTMRGRKKP